MTTVFIVPTPIGNLQDITIRAITTLFESDIILTEEIIRTKNLLTHLQNTYPHIAQGNTPKIIQFNEFLENTHLEKYTALLEQDVRISITSSAGTPLFSDPGYRLIQYALKKNIPVISLPGPTAAIPALTLSGMPIDQVFFLGFLPKKVGKKQKIIQNLKDISNDIFRPTLVIYESPHRLVETLEIVNRIMGNVDISISRELTKIHEENLRIPIEEAIKRYTTTSPKGEFVLVFSI